MDTPRLFARRRVQSGRRPVLGSWFCGLTLLVQASQAAQPAIAPSGASLGHFSATGVHLRRGDAAEVVSDVFVRPDGVLRGRVVDAAGGHPPDGLAGLRVSLLRGQETVALTATGRRGEFALRNISGGLYQLVVDDSGTPRSRFYRVWTSLAAPPQAEGGMNVPIGGTILRGQHPFPFPVMSLQQAATVTGIVAGAIAAPVIYHNTLTDNMVPQSP